MRELGVVRDRLERPGHEIDGCLAIRGGPGCLNRFSASLSGASAGVRLPSGLAAG